jgi:GxxExxY protein
MDIRDKETYAIIGAAMTVHKKLGCGFIEAVYQEALEKEFQYLNIPYEREKIFPINYRNHKLKTYFQADFICYGEVIVELKVLQQMQGIEHTQVINYLKVAGLNRAMLINFGEKTLQYKRVVFNLRDSEE